jgi:hypothetical protein
MASPLALPEEIRQAGADDSRAVVIMPVWDHESLVWHREFADTPADRLGKRTPERTGLERPSL